MKYQMKVEYLPGKYMHLADLLSRNFQKGHVDDDPEMTHVVHEVTRSIPMSPDTKKDLEVETAGDVGLAAVTQYYKKGWPQDRHQVIMETRPYWQIRHDIFLEDKLVIFNDRIIVPVSLRPKVLNKLHAAHLGAEKTKARARQAVYWPGLTSDIENMVKACRICERNRPANPEDPLQPHEIPMHRYEKWLELKKLSSNSSAAVTAAAALRQVFSTHGVPRIIFGDNNPLNSFECREFAASIGSIIQTSSPEFPSSNGLAEKGVHISKQLLTKSEESGTHYLDDLREYNNTPLSGMTVSPSQILMSRICRTGAPILSKNLVPKIVDVHKDLKRLQQSYKAKHDKSSRVINSL
ncbi:hypothetical protein KUF71_019749 [Frankliniella fusca]|uniref:RNA-directed DNA polymerase n=1 Tax=Frankliniella fusca TaxID=407009 RepID=A0AAE1L819_9NEOP|nr:hypothetical protein KUF71_019749 [Frankliniella fusca]